MSSKETPSWNNTTATLKANLVLPGDSIEYLITVENRGNIDAKLDKITTINSNNPAIIFETEGLEEGYKLVQGASATMVVRITYNEATSTQPENIKSDLNVTLDYVEEDGTGIEPPADNSAANMLKSLAVTIGDGLYEEN